VAGFLGMLFSIIERNDLMAEARLKIAGIAAFFQFSFYSTDIRVCQILKIPDDTLCNDGLYCTGTDTCSSGSCSVHTGDPCASRVGDNDNDCSESCNETNDNCTANDPNGSTCNDGTYCNGTDTCNEGVCVHSGDPCPGVSSCDEEINQCLCDSGVDCDDADSSVNPGAEEVCNPVDDDCDGQLNEGYVPYTCGEGVCARESTCIGGIESCVEGFPNAGEDEDDDCNGFDDDCDGYADDDGYCVFPSSEFPKGDVAPGRQVFQLIKRADHIEVVKQT